VPCLTGLFGGRLALCGVARLVPFGITVKVAVSVPVGVGNVRTDVGVRTAGFITAGSVGSG
jgi:hypothetical protein